MITTKRTARRRANAPGHGYCECGCGQRTPLSTRNRPDRGIRKGEPVRYLRGHTSPPHYSGAENPRYNGGLCVRDDGRCVIVCRDGTLLYYYRGMMAAHIGRLLMSYEIVHHRNGDWTDDRIENLEITTRAAHMNHHRADLMRGRRAS